jgi:hypothetical protein
VHPCVSFVGSLRATGNLSTTERSVEWLRGHHFGPLVSWVENTYYSNQQPPTGGNLTGTLPNAEAPRASATPAGPALGITPLAGKPVVGEGNWTTYGDRVGGTTAMQVAYLRPDSVHGTVLAGVVRIDQTKAAFRLIPGSSEPGHNPWPGGHHVASTDAPDLLAAFNSGFRIADANGGFEEAGRTAGTLRNGAASLVIGSDGTLDVVRWGPDVVSRNPVAVRQNLDLIVDNGILVDGLDDNVGNRWGLTVGNKLFVWRSGIGVDANGNVIYVASEGLSVKTLAALLQRAGAVRAMELDINHAWVSFNAFHHDTTGVHGSKLLTAMSKPSSRYLTDDARDFVAVIARQPLVAG